MRAAISYPIQAHEFIISGFIDYAQSCCKVNGSAKTKILDIVPILPRAESSPFWQHII